MRNNQNNLQQYNSSHFFHYNKHSHQNQYNTIHRMFEMFHSISNNSRLGNRNQSIDHLAFQDRRNFHQV